MFQDFLSILPMMVSNKRVLAAWLITLTAATAQIGEKVFVQRTKELAIVETKVDSIKDSLNKIERQLELNGGKLDTLLADNIRIKADLDAAKNHQKKLN